MKRAVYYLNQFFGSIGGEEAADTEVMLKEEPVGPAEQFQEMSEEFEVPATIICGDNYINENTEKALADIKEILQDYDPDLIAAGPAFNAGRYGVACAEVCKLAVEELSIPAVTGMYEENPGLDMCRREAIVVETVDSAAGMRKALPDMARIGDKLVRGEELDRPAEENYIPQGRRKTVFREERGSERAVKMLLQRLNDEDFTTELPMPQFDRVKPAEPVEDISKARVGLVSSGGIVPKGNPDSIESASASRYGCYDISKMGRFSSNEFQSIHGGYDPVYANEDPNRVVPLDVLRQLDSENRIGELDENYYVTTGTGTSVENSERLGEEIARDLKDGNVQAVILTST